jgi:hypothetical protein
MVVLEMASNIIKIIISSIIVSVIIAAAAYYAVPAESFQGKSTSEILVTGIIFGGVLTSLIVFLVVPVSRPIQKQTLFVGNLAFKATDNDLRKLFSEYGEVFSIRLMVDRHTRKPRGYGFIEMDNAGARKAIAALNEFEFMGRPLRVNQANAPKEKSQEGGA